MKATIQTATLFALTAFAASAQSIVSGGPSAAVPVRMVITAEPLRGSQAPPLSAADVSVFEDRTQLPVTGLMPLTGENAALEFYILIDERLDPAQTPLFDQLRQFVAHQAPETAVGIAYMFNGEARIAQPPTTDHTLAERMLRISSGSESAAASPYTSLSVLVNGWKPSEAHRREVLIVTDGMDRFNSIGDYNMYVEDSVADAQRAGVIVYTMYAPSLGHASHSPELIRWGQTYLGQIAEETGGEAYLPNPAATASYETYLADLTRHLGNQYLITFLATPQPGEGYQRVSFEAREQNADLIAARRFYLKAVELSENNGVLPQY